MNVKSVPKEKITHGDTLFPLHVYQNDVGYASRIMECHWHEETEIIYMKRGKAVFQINTVDVEIGEGEVTFVNGGSLHSGFSSGNTQCEFYAIVFDLNMLSSSTSGMSQSKFINPLLNNQLTLPVRPFGSTEGVVKQVLEIMESFGAKLPGFELCIKGSLYKIFSLLIQEELLQKTGEERAAGSLDKIRRIKAVLNYIDDNYQGKIKVPDMAAEINMSTYHFCRFFKYMTGRTPVEYVNYLRINRAAELLLQSERKVTDIALEAGFDNISYFIKIFKNAKGYTPVEFRKCKG